MRQRLSTVLHENFTITVLSWQQIKGLFCFSEYFFIGTAVLFKSKDNVAF